MVQLKKEKKRSTLTEQYDSRSGALALLSWAFLMLHLWVTHHPTLNSTWASKRATTGAVATLHPLTRDRIKPSCLSCRTIFMNPGRWLLVSDTKSWSFSFSSSARKKQMHISIWRYHLKRVRKVRANYKKTSTHKNTSCPPPVGSISLVGGQQHFCFTALITGPNRQQLEPALQTSMGLTSHNGILQYWELSLQCFSKHGRKRWNVCGLMFGFKVYLHYYLSCILCDESRHGDSWLIAAYMTNKYVFYFKVLREPHFW